ncbi:hypothetical protein ED733_006786 [Metarhizium rileyi]|uniref:Uncharacterized protein n=1 Tax=Metarhizium rileyi (strain RCEF 4871) TaxID=1649241 RepID=A0A5C6GP42_METRR|nr:hypothetical protein ED733_006786 [Metarhizium rileyi]
MAGSDRLCVYESTDLVALLKKQLETEPPTSYQGGGMLSVDFSTPLGGAARAERIRQMSHNHPAFEKSRFTQEILVKIQHALRRMPGVSANESGEIVAQLQEVGQIISQETSQLVDALMNLTLDQEETDKALSRMSLEATLIKAETDDKAQAIRDLRAEVDAEKKKREQAEHDVKEVMSDLHGLTEDFKKVKERAARKDEDADADTRDDMVKGLEDTIRHLEDQVNNRRSLWVMKHPDPQSVARAIETLADSVQENQVAQQTILSMKSRATRGGESFQDTRPQGETETRPYIDMAPPPRPASVFQPTSRSSTAAPPKFGPLQAGPPRAPSAFSHERRYQGSVSSWGSGQGRATQTGNPFYANTTSSFSRPPARKPYHAPTRYRPTAPEFQPGGVPEQVPVRPGTAFGHHQPSREYYPQTPTSRSRYGRLAEPNLSDYGSAPSSTGNTMAVRNCNVSGPLIHMNERTVAAWNESIMDFYAMIRAFVERHANVPDPAMAMKMSATPLWPVLLATYHPLSAKEASSYLDIHLRADNPKCCLVTRVIIDYIVNRVWVPNAWIGSDGDCTYALLELEKDLEKTQGQPSAQRQPLLDRQAHILEAIVKSEPPSFHKDRTNEITTSLLSTIQPLLNRLANPADAYRDLEQVAELAWDLSSKILTSRLTFDFRFPEVGTRFSSQSMLPIWPALEPSELQAKHWRVALVTTPVITCRNDTGSNISAHSVALADVYCMQ